MTELGIFPSGQTVSEEKPNESKMAIDRIDSVCDKMEEEITLIKESVDALTSGDPEEDSKATKGVGSDDTFVGALNQRIIRLDSTKECLEETRKKLQQFI